MKRFLKFSGSDALWLAIGFIALFTPGHLFGQEPIIDVNTTKVHLRRNDAIITAQSKPFTLRQGINKLIFRGIAPSAIESSIRINAGESVRILSYAWRTDSVFAQDARLKELTKEISICTDTFRSLIRSEKRLLYSKKILDANINIDVSDKSIYIDDLDELVVYYKNALRKWDNEIKKLKHHKNIVSHQLDSLKTSKSVRVATLKSLNTALYVELSAQLEGERILDFTYQLESAFWRPDYFIYLKNEKVASIEMSAVVSQHTGIPWNNVQMTFEFGQPSEGALDKVYSSNFLISNQKVNVPSGVKVYVFNLKVMDCGYSVINMSNPNTSAHPFNSLLISDLSGFSLPKGRVTIKMPNGYQKSDTLSSELTQDSSIFFIGVNNEILCTKAIAKEKLTKAIVANKQTFDLEWEATLVNSSTQSQTITYTDIIPSNIPGATIENDLPRGSQVSGNQFTYTVTLQPGQTLEFTYRFKIQAPKGVDLNGYYK